MTRPVRAVLDTGAVLAYADGAEALGGVLVEAGDVDWRVLVPSTCLLEAYRIVEPDEYETLALLRLHPTVLVVNPGRGEQSAADDCAVIGIMARLSGRLGAGHCAALALSVGAEVVTSQPDQILELLPGWRITEV